MSAIIPGPYSIPGTIKQPATLPVPMPEQEKPLPPSIDPYINEQDRWTVGRLPTEGKKQFSENIHQYIGQLGKDYGVTVPGEIHEEDGESTIRDLIVSILVDDRALIEALDSLRAEGRRKLGYADE